MWHEWSTLKKLIWLRILQGASAIIKTVTGTAPLTLTNAINGAIISLTQYGKCTQASTPTPDAPVDIVCNNGAIKYGALGANLLDPSVANTVLGYYINKSDGAVKDSAYNFMFANYMPVIGGKTYVAYGRRRTDNDLSDYNCVAWYDGTKTWISGADYTQNRIAVVTAPSNAAYARFSCNPSGGTTVAVTQEIVDSYNWTFCEGTAEITPFVPFEGGILADGADEVLTVSGVNLCNPALYTGDGWYIGTNNTVSSAASNGTLVFPCKPNTTYSWWHTSGAGGARAFELTTDEVTAGQSATWAVGNPAFSDAMTVRKYTTSANAKLLCVLFARVADQVGRTIDEQLADFMLVEGDIDTAMKYQPYSAPQTASVVNLYSAGDYADTQDIISGTIHRNVHVIVCDGTEDWRLSNQSILGGKLHRYRLQTTDGTTAEGATKYNVFCSHFADTLDFTVGSCIYATSGKNLYCIPIDQTIDDAVKWKAWVAAQYAAGTPLIIIYPIDNGATESVTAQPLQTSAGDNTVSVTSNVDPVELEVQYSATA